MDAIACRTALILVSALILLSPAALADDVVQPPAASPATAAADTVLEVIDEAGAEHAFTQTDIARLPRQTVRVTSRGTDASFEGVLLVDLLKSAGVSFENLRGRRTPTIAILEATDGYRVVISLLEIDPGTTDRLALVADRRDGQPLDENLGPLRLVIPGDKREVRWIRNLRTIRVMNLSQLPLRKASAAKTGGEQQ
jgi:hypothetical protein